MSVAFGSHHAKSVLNLLHNTGLVDLKTGVTITKYKDENLDQNQLKKLEKMQCDKDKELLRKITRL